MTSAWTDAHSRVALAFAVGFAGCLMGLAEEGALAFWVAGAVALAAIASLALDAFGGIVAGLVAAAALVAVKRLAGEWNSDAFLLSSAETVVILLAGVTAGLAGAALRRADSDRDDESGILAPVFGSLGLLSHDVAMARLEEEVERAREHRRPLTVIRVDVDITAASLDAPERDAAVRAVARILESRLHERDVPFAITPDRLGAILPETDAAEGWQRVGEVADALAAACFTSRTTETRIRVADAVEIRVGLAQFGPRISSADALLDFATPESGQPGELAAGTRTLTAEHERTST